MAKYKKNFIYCLLFVAPFLFIVAANLNNAIQIQKSNLFVESVIASSEIDIDDDLPVPADIEAIPNRLGATHAIYFIDDGQNWHASNPWDMARRLEGSCWSFTRRDLRLPGDYVRIPSQSYRTQPLRNVETLVLILPHKADVEARTGVYQRVLKAPWGEEFGRSKPFSRTDICDRYEAKVWFYDIRENVLVFAGYFRSTENLAATEVMAKWVRDNDIFE